MKSLYEYLTESLSIMEGAALGDKYQIIRRKYVFYSDDDLFVVEGNPIAEKHIKDGEFILPKDTIVEFILTRDNFYDFFLRITFPDGDVMEVPCWMEGAFREEFNRLKRASVCLSK